MKLFKSLAAVAITIGCFSNTYPAKANALGDQIMSNWNVIFSDCYQAAYDDYQRVIRSGELPSPRWGTLEQAMTEYCQSTMLAVASGDPISVAKQNATKAIVDKYWL